MKKIFHLILGMVTILVAFIVFISPTFADVNYDITNVDVIAHINPNGSLSMERRITYKFDDSAHGVFIGKI